MKTFRSGFTLIEVLIATVILSVTLVVLYSGFQIGMLAYKQTEENLSGSREGEIFLFQFSQELTQSFPYFKSSFQGKKDSVSFPTELKHYNPKGVLEELYVVEYHLEGKTLVRSEKKLRNDKLRKEAVAKETIFEDLSSCQFEYLTLDDDQKFRWNEKWLNQPYVGLPRAL